MGRLVYDEWVRLEIDDRTLGHLQIVIGEKLRRGEAFPFTWAQPAHEGSGRVTVWVHPDSALRFTFRHGGPREISREWVDALMDQANSPAGLQPVPDPAAAED